MQLPNSLQWLGLWCVYAALVGIFLGMQGIISLIVLGVLFVYPFYLILDNFELAGEEKFVFAFFLSAGFMSMIVYWVGFFLTIKMATLFASAVFIGVGLGLKKWKKDKVE